jgi:ATP-dependent Clp protease ATP-binding subunit ClpA
MALLGGTIYRGQYEERLQAIVAEVSAAPDVILFIDELHNLIGQGTAQGAAMDAGNMLKPALTRGDFRVVGATTSDEYERWIMMDAALERRFQRIDVRELTAEETREVLRARRPVLERHHGVVVTDDALEAALKLTDKWMTERMRPDRAIDALDEACAHLQAVTVHAPRSEMLLKERRALLTERAVASAARRDVRGDAATENGADAVASDGTDANGATPTERFDRLTRDGIAALEKFGAEIESFFGEPRPQPIPKPRPRPSYTTAESSTATHDGPLPPPASRLAEIEAELSTLLVADGAVVRGYDVARVLASQVGRSIAWP